MQLWALFHFTLKVIRSIDRQSLAEDFAGHLAGLRDIVIEENELERFRKIIYYISKRGNLAAEEIINHIDEMPQPLTEETMNAYDELIERGRAIGLKEGREETMLEVTQRMLIRQIEHRFGSLSAAELSRVTSCTDQTKLDAASLVFADGKSKDEVLAAL